MRKRTLAGLTAWDRLTVVRVLTSHPTMLEVLLRFLLLTSALVLALASTPLRADEPKLPKSVATPAVVLASASEADGKGQGQAESD
jgi:hypothetical protein